MPRRLRALSAGMLWLTAMLLPWSLVGASDARTLRSASELDYPPYAIVTPGGEATGMSVDLLRAAAASVGLAVEIGVGPWAEIKSALINRELDVLPLVARTPEREAVMDFSRPYHRLQGAIVVRKDSAEVAEVSDLRGLEVALMAGDAAEEYARRSGVTDRLVPVRSAPEALRVLSFGDVDAVLIWGTVGRRLIDDLGLTNLRVLDVPVVGLDQALCFAVPEGDHALRERLDLGLANIVADGSYDAILDRWLRSGSLPSAERSFRFGYAAFGLLVMLIAAAGILLQRRGRSTPAPRDG